MIASGLCLFPDNPAGRHYESGDGRHDGRGRCRGNYIGEGATGCPQANDGNHVSAAYNVFVPRPWPRATSAKKLFMRHATGADEEKT